MIKVDEEMGGKGFPGDALKDCKFNRETIRLRVREKFLIAKKRGF